MIGREEILGLIPHQGAMCLLDRVVEWDHAHIVCASDSHRRADNPLREPDGRVRAIHLCEYGAQAMAVHGGLLARADGSAAQPGLLVSLRAVRLHLAHVHALPGPIEVRAEKLLDGGASWQYGFVVSHEAVILAEGRAAVMMR